MEPLTFFIEPFSVLRAPHFFLFAYLVICLLLLLLFQKLPFSKKKFTDVFDWFDA